MIWLREFLAHGRLILWVVVLSFGSVLSCGGAPEDRGVAELTVLRVGVLPDESTEALHQKYDPLLEVVSGYIGIPCELVIRGSYEDLVEAISQGEVDLAFLGGYSYVLANEQSGAEALVQRDLDARFTSYLIARGDDTRAGVSDFSGGVLSFGARLSTSGHLMPRLFFVDEGISPETFFDRVVYSNTHDLTVLSVVEGKTDLGAVNAQIYERMIADGRIDPNTVRVVAETPPYTNYVWAVHPSVSEKWRIEIRDAFLSLSQEEAAQRSILDTFGAKTFLPVSDSDYDRVRRAVKAVDGV